MRQISIPKEPRRWTWTERLRESYLGAERWAWLREAFPVGVVWEIPRLGREQALMSAEWCLAGREGARHPRAARPLAGPWRALAPRALGQNAKEAVPQRGADPCSW